MSINSISSKKRISTKGIIGFVENNSSYDDIPVCSHSLTEEELDKFLLEGPANYSQSPRTMDAHISVYRNMGLSDKNVLEQGVSLGNDWYRVYY